MNGTPNLVVMRSISLYGLSDVILTFQDGTDPYFARNVVFQRLSDATLPTGVTPRMALLFSPSGLVYRYVLESPDRSAQELHTIEDWVVERAYRGVPGVADDSGFGGTTMQYQVLLDPSRLYNYHIPLVQVINALSINNANTGGGFYLSGGQFYYVRGLGLLPKTVAGYRFGGRRQREWRAGAYQGYRSRGNWPRAAPWRIRIHENGRRRRRRHPNAYGRANANCSERRRAKNVVDLNNNVFFRQT